MHDRVAEVLSQRATLDRGAGIGVVVSIVLHVALTGAVAYTALHAKVPEAAKMVNITFAKMPAQAAPAPARRERPAQPAPVAPAIEEPKIVEPRPVVEKPPENKPPEKNTVPVSPFGRSTKKGSETPAVTPPAPAPAQAPPGTTTDVAVGGSGVTGVEGGDFPYALYLQGMHRRIGNNWIRPTVSGATVVIFFRIRRDGTIVESRIATPSGNPTFDRAALSAIRSASPLNPLPFAYSGNELGIYLTFR
jgi:periplasmic protein TonB